MSKKKNECEYQAQGDYLFLEKIDYEEEITTTAGIIYKKSTTLSSNYAEAKVIARGPGLPLLNGEIQEPAWNVGDTVLYDVRGRIGLHDDFDVIRAEHVVAIKR